MSREPVQEESITVKRVDGGLPWIACYFIGALIGIGLLMITTNLSWYANGLIGGNLGGIMLGPFMRQLIKNRESSGSWRPFPGITLVSCIIAFASLIPGLFLGKLCLHLLNRWFFRPDTSPPERFIFTFSFPGMILILCIAGAALIPGLVAGHIKKNGASTSE